MRDEGGIRLQVERLVSHVGQGPCRHGGLWQVPVAAEPCGGDKHAAARRDSFLRRRGPGRRRDCPKERVYLPVLITQGLPR